MRGVLISVLLAAAFAGSALAAEGDKIVRSPAGVEYALPADSPVTFTAFKGGTLQTTGKFTVSGMFHYSQPTENAAECTGNCAPGFFFRPDPDVGMLLPHSVADGTAERLDFVNEDEAIRAIVDTAAAADVKARKVLSVSGRVTLVLDGYAAGTRCNAPGYTVHFVKVEEAGAFLPARNVVTYRRC